MSTALIPPAPHAVGVMLLTVFALFLFTRERIPLETSSLLVLTLLTVGFHLFPFDTPFGEVSAVDFFSGFGHQALIAVSALMVAGHGLVRTGALEQVGRLLAGFWSRAPRLAFLLTLLAAASLSAFINNTPIVVLFLPILVSVSLRSGGSASSMLMPMGFATLLGGTSTTIGTSTNLLVVSVAADLGLREIGMFDFVVPAVIAGVAGIAYLWLLAPRLLPKLAVEIDDFSAKIFSGQLHIRENSFGDGKTLAELIAKSGGTLKVQNILRTEHTRVYPLPDVRVLAGDRLLVHDTAQNLKEFEQVLGASLYTDKQSNAEEVGDFAEQDQQLAEVIVNRESPLRTRTLAEVRFAEQYKLIILAIHRGGKKLEKMRGGIGNVRLRVGDVLLVQGRREDISSLKRSGLFLVLDNTTDLPHSALAPVALVIMAAIVLLTAFSILPIAL
ncbi:MAG: SLC13 family permease, partial [Gammaproteobacteria bacterium]|nr:SLC13 family permease [Gammaproteobacteria bacterium]